MPGKLYLIPTHAKWTTLKAKHELASNAVMSIDVGKALDVFESKEKAGIQYASANGAACEELEKKLAAYIQKLDKKKVKKDYAGFQRTFLNDYVGTVKAKGDDYKRYNADADVYKKELLGFFSAVQQLVPGKTTVADLGKFKSGPLRGLSAVGSALKGFDLAAIDTRAGKIQQVIDKLPPDASQDILKRFIEAVVKTAVEMNTEAKKLGLM